MGQFTNYQNSKINQIVVKKSKESPHRHKFLRAKVHIKIIGLHAKKRLP